MTVPSHPFELAIYGRDGHLQVREYQSLDTAMAAANSLRRHHAKLSPLRRAGGPCLSGKLAQGRLRTKEAAICEERRGATVSWERRRRARCAPRTDLFGRPFVLARRWAGLMQRRIEMLALHVADNPINGAIAALWHGRPGARQLSSESRRDPAPPTAARRPARCPSRCRSISAASCSPPFRFE
jgi:hypothetical protein